MFGKYYNHDRIYIDKIKGEVRETLCKSEFAKDILEWNPKIESCSLRDYDGPPRAADTSLDCSKLQQLLSFPLTGLTEWLGSSATQPA